MNKTLKEELLEAEMKLDRLDKRMESGVERRHAERERAARARMHRMAIESKEFVYPENVATKVSQAIADPVTVNFAVDDEGNILGLCFHRSFYLFFALFWKH